MHKFRFLTIILLLTLWLSFTAPSSQAQAVPTFGKISPTDGATDVPAASAILAWTPVVGYSGTDTITYRYCLQTKSKCPPGRWIRVGTATSVNLPLLTSTKTYYWWVRAYNSQNVLIAEADADSSGAGQAWTFKTMPLPGSFNKISPTNGSSQAINGVQLTWGSSTNPAPDHYEYCLDSSNNNRCDTQWVTADSGVTLNSLTLNTNYSWQVRAVNGSGVTLANNGTWWSFTTTIVPTEFQKLLPLDNATDQLVTGLALSWMINPNAVSYEYCVSTTNNACSTINWTNAGTSTWTAVSGLAYSTDYYWQVRAIYADNSRVAADNNVWRKFTTQPAPPAAFSKSYPASGDTNVYTDVTFTWEPSSGADSYEFCISTTNADITCGDSPWDTVDGTSYDVLGLDVDTVYYWQVRAVNTTGAILSNGGTWWSFRTQTNPPAGFTKNSPASGTSATETSLTLSWNPSATAGVNYQVCYDKTNNFFCDSNNWSPLASATSFDLTGLAYGTTYYWQVRAVGSQGMTYADGDQVVWWSFTTKLAPPSAFGKTSPSDGYDGQPITPLLQWGTSSQGVTYEYCVSATNNTCDSPQGWVPATGTSAVPSSLAYGTSYYWQVRAKNSQGTITYANSGAWWSFTTYATPPATFEKISPANNAINQPLMVFLTWSDHGPDYHYEYCITADLPFDCATWTPVYTLSVSVPGLSNDTTYRWQVRAVDDFNTQLDANDGEVWAFTTRPAPPTSSNATFNVDEDHEVIGALQGSDQLTFTLDGDAPDGTFNFQTTGHFTYTPPQDFNGTVTFQFTVSDNINEPVGPYTVTINVNPVNDAPVLDPITVPATINSGDTLSFTATATDVDLPQGQHLTFSITHPPAGTSFNTNTGVFSWTPIYIVNGVNTYNFTITVSDGSLTDFQDISVQVLQVPPSSHDETYNVDEDQQISSALHGAYTADWVFALYGGQPAGTLDLQPNGHFTYTPPSNFNGTITFQFIVSNPIQAGPYTVTMNFAPVNDAPVLDPIDVPATISSRQTLAFTATASDVDLGAGEQLTFSIDGLPAGASFDPDTGAFSWTPTWVKSGNNTYSFTVTVSDGFLTDTQDITITVKPLMIFMPIIVR